MPSPPEGPDAPRPSALTEEQRDLLLELIDLEEPEARRLLEQRVSDVDVRERLLALLTSDEDTGLFSRPLDVESPQSDRVGDRIGSYRLTERIGAGGMGAVYRAEREGDFRQTVAIKLVRTGRMTAEVEAAFAKERQSLSGLNHPNIGRFFDGGTSHDGTPYLVMELVDGVDITTFARREGLSSSQVLELFLPILSAVQAAHQQLIIHGDLKPSNILVDSQGTPKLLDFGVASLMEEDEDTALPRGLTPAYASPEQLRRQPLSVASDVYSLGVLLYQLLSGCLPMPDTAGDVTTLLETVAQSTPSPPSRPPMPDPDMRLSISPELDAIVLKALAPTTEERYASVAALEADCVRYLSHEPVQAYSAGFGYRAKKFTRRHRLAVGASTVAASALLALATVALVQAQRATDASRHSEVQRERAEAVSSFLFDLFKSANVEDSRGIRADVKVVEMLDQASERLAEDEGLDPSNRAEMWITLSDLEVSLQRYSQAKAAAAQAIAVADPPDLELTGAEAVTLAARSHRMAGISAHRASDYDEAEAAYRRGIEVIEKLDAQQLTSGETASTWRTLYGELASVYVYTDRCTEAEPLLESLIAGTTVDEISAGDLAGNYSELATCLFERDEYERSYASHEKAIEMVEIAYGPRHYYEGVIETSLGTVAHAMGDNQRAIAHYRKSIEIRRESAVADVIIALPMVRLALVLGEEGIDLDEAHEMLQFTVGAVDALEEGDTGKNYLLGSIGRAYHALGDVETALAYAQRALEGEGTILPEGSVYLETLRFITAQYKNDLGRHEEARRDLEHSLEIVLEARGPEHHDTVMTAYELREALQALGLDAEATAVEERIPAVLDVEPRD